MAERLIMSLRGRRLLFVALLVAAIAINAVQFSAADRGAKTFWQAIHRYDTSSFAEISFAGDPHIRYGYGIYRALAELAPHSTVFLAYSSPETVARLYGVGETEAVRLVHVQELDRLPTDFDPEPFFVATGEGGMSGKSRKGIPWAVALDEPDPRPADLRDPATFLDAALTTDRRGEARGGPREFVMLEWADSDVAPEFDHQHLLMETSLLPSEIQEALSR